MQQQQQQHTHPTTARNNGQAQPQGLGEGETKDQFRLKPKTFVRPSLPEDLLLHPIITSNSLKANIFIASPFHVAGGTVSGKLNIAVTGAEGADIQISRVAIDLVGIEKLSWTNRRMFLALAIELVDDSHAPPASLLRESQSSIPFWRVRPGEGVFPFAIDLPLTVGPGTFNSAGARIRYVIYGTILFKIGNTKFLIRCCRDIAIAPSISDLCNIRFDYSHEIKVYEEKQFIPARFGFLKLSASLSRPYWFSGAAAFVDIVVQNGSLYNIGKIRIKLVRYINAYKNSAVSDDEIASTGYPRNPSWTEKKTIARSELNAGSRWIGLKANHQDAVTCEIEIPKGQLTIPLDTFFEVKYFLKLTTCPKLDPHRKVKAMLPINILHTYSIHEALMTGIGYEGGISSVSSVRRSLPTTRSRSSKRTSRQGNKTQGLSHLDPIPIAKTSEATNQATASTSTPPNINSTEKSDPDVNVTANSPRYIDIGTYFAPLKSYFGRTEQSSRP